MLRYITGIVRNWSRVQVDLELEETVLLDLGLGFLQIGIVRNWPCVRVAGLVSSVGSGLEWYCTVGKSSYLRIACW